MKKKILNFRKKVYAHYRAHKRIFPWRRTRDPYKILVSEVMLQQTQVDRVIPYYLNFLEKFPDVQSLAIANTRDILHTWSGLGYNRRALYLRDMAKAVCTKYGGKIPKEESILLELPGIGPATAAAVRAFAWNLPSLYLDTNVRTVFLHEFFPKRRKVLDKEILPLLQQTLDAKNPREWYYALLDYGAMIKRTHGNPNARSAHYAAQKPFKGSDRELRGKIVRILISRKEVSEADLLRTLPALPERISMILQKLVREEFIRISSRSISLI